MRLVVQPYGSEEVGSLSFGGVSPDFKLTFLTKAFVFIDYLLLL
jgi:hypothetical protein